MKDWQQAVEFFPIHSYLCKSHDFKNLEFGIWFCVENKCKGGIHGHFLQGKRETWKVIDLSKNSEILWGLVAFFFPWKYTNNTISGTLYSNTILE